MQEVTSTPGSYKNDNPYPFPVWSGCADLGTIWLLTPEELDRLHRDVIVTSITGGRLFANHAVDSGQEVRYGYTPYGIYRNQFMDVAKAHEQRMLEIYRIGEQDD